MRWKRALITGASSGIGRAMATVLAAEGTELVVVARDKARLDALADEVSVPVEVLPADLGDRAQLATVEARVKSSEAPIDLVVNNAGFGNTGPITELSVDAETAMIDVNIVALQRLTQVAVTTMLAGSGGTVLNVSSVAGFVPTAGGGAYGATKAFVTSYSNGLNTELADTNVSVTALCPGFTETEFQDRANYDASAIPKRLWQSADEVARAGLDGAAAGEYTVVPGTHNKALVGLTKVMPAAIQRRFVGLFGSD